MQVWKPNDVDVETDRSISSIYPQIRGFDNLSQTIATMFEHQQPP